MLSWKLLTEKYPEGIWCQQLPYLYLKEYGIELEYRNLGFNDIVEFIAVLPASIFKCTRPPNSFKYKLFSSETEMLVNNQLKNSTVADSIEKVADDIKVDTSHALFTLHSCSKALSKRLIPKEFMNFEDSVKQINVATVLDNSGVIVSEIYNPSLFWIILHRNKRKLIKLMDNLQEFYLGQADLDKYKVPPIVLKPGLHVACLYSNRWHRGIVKSAANLNSSIILFYDYGTTKAYKANKLYFLHKKFSYLPAQAIPSCLYDVKPTASCNKWTQEAIEKFVDKTIEKDFLVSIHNRNQENNSITVDLIDVCTSNTINHWLVSNDLAMFVRKEINFISSEEQQYSTSYVRPAKQLEALKKYKTRLQLLEKQNLQSTSSNLSGSVEEKNKDSAKTILSNNNYYVDHCENTGIDNIQNCETQKLVIKKQHITEALKELEKLIMFTKI
ncbi:tudor domain-containing protein 15-like isoform X2 [Phymastichus coffea]|uniref:tudor domain-containing protein 15-like isoform X2 n=1 Tax=Phymastichus coffea TaxID=108790 RepID=UPI00273CC7B7|nr:tudor domain-containing protein 15-like isoform X2 [Phymastichus coffea]